MVDLTANGLSRRTILLAAAPLFALGAGAANAAGVPQVAVSYQTTPMDGKQCDGCNFFVAPDSCKVVAGTISPTGWCKLWSKKA